MASKMLNDNNANRTLNEKIVIGNCNFFFAKRDFGAVFTVRMVPMRTFN